MNESQRPLPVTTGPDFGSVFAPGTDIPDRCNRWAVRARCEEILSFAQRNLLEGLDGKKKDRASLGFEGPTLIYEVTIRSRDNWTPGIQSDIEFGFSRWRGPEYRDINQAGGTLVYTKRTKLGDYHATITIEHQGGGVYEVRARIRSAPR